MQYFLDKLVTIPSPNTFILFHSAFTLIPKFHFRDQLIAALLKLSSWLSLRLVFSLVIGREPIRGIFRKMPPLPENRAWKPINRRESILRSKALLG